MAQRIERRINGSVGAAQQAAAAIRRNRPASDEIHQARTFAQQLSPGIDAEARTCGTKHRQRAIGKRGECDRGDHGGTIRSASHMHQTGSSPCQCGMICGIDRRTGDAECRLQRCGQSLWQEVPRITRERSTGHPGEPPVSWTTVPPIIVMRTWRAFRSPLTPAQPASSRHKSAGAPTLTLLTRRKSKGSAK